MKNVLIIEDDKEISDLLEIHLKDIDCGITKEYNGIAGLNKVKFEKYDLIVLDVILPGIDGLEVCKEIRKSQILTPILMLTSKSGEIDKVLGLELGADDYLTKPFSIREFIARVKAIFRRVELSKQTEKGGKDINYKNIVIEISTHKVIINNQRIDLTPKEFDLLYLLASHPGRVYSRENLLNIIWGFQHKGYEHTVNSHINRLRNKIEKDISDPQYILTNWAQDIDLMIKLFNSLFFRISFVFLLILLVISVLYIYISVNTAEMYYQETRQKLDLNIASHIADDNKCFKDDSVNTGVLKNVFHNVMVINPSIEVYLLDTNGTILTYYAPNKVVKINDIPLEPVKKFISSGRDSFIIGIDPKSPEKMKAFSAAQVIEEGEFKGYIYVILGGQEYENASQLVFGSYILRLGVKTMIIALIAAILIGFISIGIIVWHIRRIIVVIRDFQKGNLDARIGLKSKGELKEFADSFNDMADTIVNNINEIKRIDDLRRVLVANVSHDLRTPLSIIRGYVETLILKEPNLTPQERKDYLEIILKNTDRLLKLVEELFELSRLETKETEPQKEEFSLVELLQDIYQKNLVIAQKKEINFILDIAENLPFINADIGMIEKVFQNLIDNAFKFTPSGGEVKIVFRRKYTHVLFIIISDNGLGMDQEEIPLIFDRYYQVKRISYDKYLGSGLGLSIAKRILDIHNFEVTVKSEPSKGTSFLISIPVSSPT